MYTDYSNKLGGTMNQKPKLHPAIAALIVIVLVGIVASAVIIVNATKGDDKTATTSEKATTEEQAVSGDTTDEATVDASDTSMYSDGTYSATGSYISPGGRESLDLTVTIKDGVITDTSIVTKATDRTAQQYQEQFTDNYKTLVVGKKVDGLSLSRVAGSSLTSNGFNDALDEIRNDAKA